MDGLELVLRKHDGLVVEGPLDVASCPCGHSFGKLTERSRDRVWTKVYAHRADEVRKLVREEKAEAWEEGAESVYYDPETRHLYYDPETRHLVSWPDNPYRP
jgi:hypothetical protein